MALRNIVKKGDRALTKTCRQVTDFNRRLSVLLDDMADTLIEANGVGLAAPQVGVLRRAVIVLDTNIESENPRDQIIELIDPEIVETEGEQTGPEGCLSVPEVFGLVTRPMRVKVRAYDRNGKIFERWGEGLTARAYCHEIDHLDGHLFTELVKKYLSDEELAEYYKGENS